MERRELEALQLKQASGESLTAPQEKRLQQLKKRAADHSARNSVNSIVDNTVVKNTAVRARKRATQTRRALQKHDRNKKTEASSKKRKASDDDDDEAQAQDAAQAAPSKKKKAKAELRILRGKMEYGKAFMGRMTDATRIWVRLYGQEMVFSQHFIPLLDEVLVHEAKNDKVPTLNLEGKREMKDLVFTKKSKRVRYYDHAYRKAVAPVIGKVEGQRFQYKVKNFAELNVEPSGESADVLFVQIMKELYGNGWTSYLET